MKALRARGQKFVTAQFGHSAKWEAINFAIWSMLSQQKKPEIQLSDVYRLANLAGWETNDVLAVLALLSRPASGLLKIEYVLAGTDGNTSLPNEEVVKQLRRWWREKSTSEEAWREWAENIVVKWSPALSEENGPEV